MRIPFAKSLDRPLEILGLKGKWLYLFGGAGVGFLLAAFIVGRSLGSATGIATAAFGVVGAFIVCFIMQSRYSHRRIARMFIPARIPKYVTRRETVGRVLTPDPRTDIRQNLSIYGWTELSVPVLSDKDAEKQLKDNGRAGS